MTSRSSILSKSVALLDVLGDAAMPLTFSQIVTASALNKSTVHRLLSNLAAEGLVLYDEGNKSYLLGPRLLQLARKAWRGFDIQAVALSEMLRLHEVSQENVSVGVLQGNEVVHLRMIESKSHWGTSVVMREPAHSTASGKAILAYLPEPILAGWLDRNPLTRSTKRTITTRAAFEKELAVVRKRGFASTDREEMEHVVGIAAPVFNFLDEPIAVLNIWAPTNRCSLSDLMPLSDDLMASANRVSELIGSTHTQDH